VDPGLCGHCQHARVVRTPSSTFWRCERNDAEPARFRKYPQLPVLACPGHEPG